MEWNIEFVILFTKYYIYFCEWSDSLPALVEGRGGGRGGGVKKKYNSIIESKKIERSLVMNGENKKENGKIDKILLG